MFKGVIIGLYYILELHLFSFLCLLFLFALVLKVPLVSWLGLIYLEEILQAFLLRCQHIAIRKQFGAKIGSTRWSLKLFRF